MANGKNFQALLEEAKKTPEYWVERAVLDFTEDLVSRMDAGNVSRSDLARRIRCSPAYVTKILRGSTNFTLESMVKIARALGCVLRTHLQPEGARSIWFDVLETAREQEGPFRSSTALNAFRSRFAPCGQRERMEAADDSLAVAS